jgi:CheY-like chemotaxis protein
MDTSGQIDSSISSFIILLAEDNPVNQKVAKRVLNHLGYQADIVNNGVEAVKAIGNTAYDLILMDIQMPEMDGQQATRLIRQFPQYRDAPVIAWTANACEIEAKSYVISGFSDTLVKPANNQSFRNMLIKWLPASHG